MANGKSLQTRIGSLLGRLGATSRPVSLRTVAKTGGNALLGIGGTTTTTDTLCDPQPTLELLDATIVGNSGGLYQLGDYSLMFSGSVSEATIRTSLIVYGDEVLKIIKMDPVAMNGVVVVWQVTARSIKPGA